MSTRFPSRTFAVVAAALLFLANAAAVEAAYTSTLVGSTATMTGDAAGDTLSVTQAGGLFKHNRKTAGDPLFNSDFDFDTSVPGDQTMDASTGIINIDAGDGNDTIALADGINLRGAVDGGPGIDTLDYAAWTAAVHANLSLGTTGLIGTLSADQENPATTSAAAGTVTVTNYSIATHTFDITVTVTGLPPASVIGFHIHQAPVGVNGPIAIDLMGLAPLVPAGSGFTFVASGVALPPTSEAAFLGGGMYVNLHTTAIPNGAIRGQVFSGSSLSLASGRATGTGLIAHIENVTGGTGNDSLVGSFAVNTINGNGGTDWIVGGPGNDTLNGGADSDFIVWSNGDGTDVVEGGTGADTVQVNGSPASADTFLVSANGTRLRFDRTNLGLFSLDIGSTEALIVNGIDGGDGFTVNNLAGVSSLTAVSLNGLTGDDTFTIVQTSAGPVAFNVHGGAGADTLQGPDGTETWNVTAANVGNIAGLVSSFRFIEMLVGGTASDTFNVKAFVTGTPAVVGGNGSPDALIYDAQSRPVSGDATPPDGFIDSPGVQAVVFSQIETVQTSPSVSPIANQTTGANAPIAIPLTVDDLQTAVGSLTLSGSSSNATLLPTANILFGGSGANRTVTLTPAANQVGTSTITVTVSDGNLSASTTFVLTVTPTPTVSIDKSSLTFGAVTTGAAFSSKTSTQTVRLLEIGTGPVTWTAASNAPWLVVSPTSGSGSATLNISVQFAAGLNTTQGGSVTLTITGAANTAGPIAVTLNTISNGTFPFGAFDTPLDLTNGVAGSIPVTGWALDDVEVTGVRIMRDPVAGEPAGTLVFIGNAVLVDGARPDVQTGYPAMPRASRAGFGYLMLTNFLPNLGNGTFKLWAIADDADGHSTTLGSKTIACTNNTATAPFGAIDTPAQGGTVSGTITNFGWVLSPAPRRSDPPAGGTVRIAVDGAFLSTVPTGWTSRSDLSALFTAAQFPGIVNALGVAVFDSTSLANGVHTISWVVTDNLGSASGIGSRYFTVSNGALFLDPEALLKTDATDAAAELLWLPPAGSSLRGRRGFDPDAAYGPYLADVDGRITVQSEELDRIELHLGDGSGQTYAGYLRVGDRLTPLPIGSSLDPVTGVFTWMPGVGFVGTYDLVFARQDRGHTIAREDVRIVLNPMRSNRLGPQTVIDLPAAASADVSVVGRSFVVAGWAADLDSTVDRGVDTVHVWAYPVNSSTGSGQVGDDPIWVGAADYGGPRPDVAAIYGNRFLTTGYGITVGNLAPGTYDVAVFAYSTVKRGFVPAKTVRVTVK